MNLRINRHLFSQVNIDTGSLSMLSTVVHKFVQPGEYEGTVMRGSVITRQFTIIVEDRDKEEKVAPVGAIGVPTTKSKQTKTSSIPQSEVKGTAPPNQVTIDLKDIRPEQFALASGGHAVFHVSTGTGGYTVQLHKFEKGIQVKVFDSCELKDEDMLSIIVIRPGTYSITNTLYNSKAQLVVNYPELGKTQIKPLPVRIECNSKNQIKPNKIRVDAGQGLIFTFKTPSRIKIELIKPEDRPSRLQNTLTLARAEKGEKRIIRKYRLMPRSSES